MSLFYVCFGNSAGATHIKTFENKLVKLLDFNSADNCGI
jgi:hypothetical protein